MVKPEYHQIGVEKYGPLAEKIINFIYDQYTVEALSLEEIGIIMAALQSILLGMKETLEKNGGGFGYRKSNEGMQ